MRKLLKDIKWSLILASPLYLFLGLALLIWPHTSNLILCCIVAGVLTAYGLFNIIAYFGKERGSVVGLVIGIICAGFGLYALVQPPVSATSSLSSWASPFWWTAPQVCGGILNFAPWLCSVVGSLFFGCAHPDSRVHRCVQPQLVCRSADPNRRY